MECLFCSIAEGKDPKSTLLYQNDRVVVFKDIRPAAPHHYLAVPKEHIRDARSLQHEHIPLVEELLSAGKQVLEEQGGKIDEAKYGFHWPPFCSVYHLHLHVIWPPSQIKFMYKFVIPKYSHRIWAYKTVDYVLERLRNMKPVEDATSPPQPEGATL